MEYIGKVLANVFGDKFKIVYWVIAIATAQHTAWGAATTMQGTGGGDWLWWAQGLAFAIAIDYSMVAVASKIRSGGNQNAGRYALTFTAVALLSSYFQLLYAWAHITDLPAGAGVALDWKTNLQGLIDIRLLIAPFALPVISILYTVAGLGKGGEKVSNRSKSVSNGTSIGNTGIRVEVPMLPKKSTLGHSKQSDAAIKVREYYAENPAALQLNPKEVAALLGVGKSTVYSIRKTMSVEYMADGMVDENSASQ